MHGAHLVLFFLPVAIFALSVLMYFIAREDTEQQ